MLVRLLAEQISEYWETIRYSIESSLPPIANESYDKMNRLLECLLNESMQCWVSYREEEKRNENKKKIEMKTDKAIIR